MAIKGIEGTIQEVHCIHKKETQGSFHFKYIMRRLNFTTLVYDMSCPDPEGRYMATAACP